MTGQPSVCILLQEGMSSRVSAAWHFFGGSTMNGQSTTATNRHHSDMTSDVFKVMLNPNKKTKTNYYLVMK